MIETDFTLKSSRNVDEVCKYLRERCVQFPFSYNDDTLRDKSIIITGGASGLGAAFTRSFLTAGAYVVFLDLNEDAGRRLEEELEDGGLHTRYDGGLEDQSIHELIATDTIYFVRCNVLGVTSTGFQGSPKLLPKQGNRPCHSWCWHIREFI